MLGSHLLQPFAAILQGQVRRITPTSRQRRLSPVQTIALSFALVILAGAMLLTLPIAQKPGVHVPPLDCLFVATSATCVTGLVTVSTADSWTHFGQLVILLLIQIGGLGYMTVATIFALLLGLRVGLRARLQLMEAHGVITLHDAVRVVRYVAVGTLVLEGAGALLLASRFHAHHGMSIGRALYEGIFYSVSAFCNAGFDLAPGFSGLWHTPFRHDIWMLLVIGNLIILGGLGFGVLAELGAFPRKRVLSLHAKLVLTVSAALIVIGMLAFILFERYNPATLLQLDNPAQKLVTSWFMSVTPRTAGFSPVDLTAVTPPTLFVTGLLMIIGASPDSTGGGVKTITVAIIILAIATLVRRRSDIEAYGRRISGDMVRLALSLVSVYLLAVLLVIVGISIVEIAPGPNMATPDAASMSRYGRLMFEVVSAFGTVGLSAGVTPTLAPISRVLIIVGMFLGRLGPLAFVFIFAQPKRQMLRRLPAESVMAG